MAFDSELGAHRADCLLLRFPEGIWIGLEMDADRVGFLRQTPEFLDGIAAADDQAGSAADEILRQFCQRFAEKLLAIRSRPWVGGAPVAEDVNRKKRKIQFRRESE